MILNISDFNSLSLCHYACVERIYLHTLICPSSKAYYEWVIWELLVDLVTISFLTDLVYLNYLCKIIPDTSRIFVVELCIELLVASAAFSLIETRVKLKLWSAFTNPVIKLLFWSIYIDFHNTTICSIVWITIRCPIWITVGSITWVIILCIAWLIIWITIIRSTRKHKVNLQCRKRCICTPVYMLKSYSHVYHLTVCHNWYGISLLKSSWI